MNAPRSHTRYALLWHGCSLAAATAVAALAYGPTPPVPAALAVQVTLFGAVLGFSTAALIQHYRAAAAEDDVMIERLRAGGDVDQGDDVGRLLTLLRDRGEPT